MDTDTNQEFPALRVRQLFDVDLETPYQQLQKLVPTNMLPLLCDVRLKYGRTVDFKYRPGLMAAPAGKGIHHSEPGGLVIHLTEMLTFLPQVFEMIGMPLYQEHYWHAQMAIVLHDLHKAYECFEWLPEEKKFQYSTNYHTTHLTKNQLTTYLISRYVPNLPIEVHHILHCSEGGWAENPPKETSVAAKAAYLCDELSVLKWRASNNRIDSNYDRSESFFL